MTTNAADGACAGRRLLQKTNPRPAMAAMAMTPPATPPAMAPVFDPLPEEVGMGEVDAGAEEKALEVGLIVEEADVPISSPGRISGVPEERRSVRRER